MTENIPAIQEALLGAIRAGDQAMVLYLLEQGADINFRCDFYGGPLVRAIGKRDVAMVRLLLEQGADPNLQTLSKSRLTGVVTEDLTPLMGAAWKGEAEIVGLLLEYGADVNGKGCIGDSALEQAQYKGHTKVIDLLKQAGAKE